MKVRLTIDVGAFERFVIARYYESGAKARSRATRQQVRRFALAALRSATVDRAADMRGRPGGAARRLLAKAKAGELPYREARRLDPLPERQPALW